MRQWNRKMRKRIEAVLHPLPKFGGFEIVHEHKRNGTCRFSAWRWREDEPFKMPDGEQRFIDLVREAFIDNPNFYTENIDNWNWLMGKEEPSEKN